MNNITFMITPNPSIPEGVKYTVNFLSPISQSTSAVTPNKAIITFPRSKFPSNVVQQIINYTIKYSGCSSSINGSVRIFLFLDVGVYPFELPYMSCATPPPVITLNNTLLYALLGIGSLAAVSAGIYVYMKRSGK